MIKFDNLTWLTNNVVSFEQWDQDVHINFKQFIGFHAAGETAALPTICNIA